MNLCGLHLVCVDPEVACLADLVIALQDQGCTVHLAQNHFQGLGLYWRLYSQDLVPRALITEWNLVHPRSKEQHFYNVVNRPQAGTAMNLIARVRQLDPTVSIIVSTHDRNAVPTDLGLTVIEKGDVRAALAALETMVRGQNYHHHRSEMLAL